MDFFIAWTRTDPIYCDYFADCCMLISPGSIRNGFKIVNWSSQPKQLLVDSGAFYYLSTSNILPSQKRVFTQQLKIIKGSRCPVLLCHLDHPISSRDANTTFVLSAIEKTISNAYEFLDLYRRYQLDKSYNIEPLAAIQGNDKLSIQFCAGELKKLGFKKFGLGSLASLFNPLEILNRVQFASEIVGGENLHIFGISRLDIINELNACNIMSIDSTRPIKSAIYNAVFYSNPFRTFGIKTAKNATSYSHTIDKPLDCGCPICKNDPSLLMQTGRKHFANARAIHNYYHLMMHLRKDING